MKLITTEDGSSSIYVEALDEQYHSIHGAITESMHIYINYGYNFFLNKKDKISVLEMGFGTGLNTLLTVINSKGINVKYTSLEKFPIADEMIKQLNYGALVANGFEWFNLIHKAKWEKEVAITTDFLLTKTKSGIEEFVTSNKFDLIYYDAFAPKIQPELWTKEIFVKCFNLLNTGGCLITYCAQGQVKRNMKAAGFVVEGLPGPPGKREITRAIK